MQESSNRPDGVAILCDSSGKVKEVINDDLGLFNKTGSAEELLVTSFFDKSSVRKGLRLIKQVDEEGTAYDWEINISGEELPELLFFSGIKSEGNILLIGSPATERDTDYYDRLMEINNEHINQLRKLMKEQSMKDRKKNDRSDLDLYEEMSELNNELASAQRKLAKQKAELERLNETKNQMLGMAAHDLRNPLSVIQGLSSLLLEDAGADDGLTADQAKYIEEIHNSSEFMLRIIEDMLDISAIESGSINLEIEEVELTGFIERVVSLNEAEAEKKEIEIATDLPAAELTVEIDPHKFEQVFNNLISNAIKYSHSDSVVTVGLEESTDKITVYVQDEGQGIPEDEIDELFKPFADISVQSTADEKSTGLGLAITKKILDAHGFDISVNSEVGKGTVFYIRLDGKT